MHTLRWWTSSSTFRILQGKVRCVWTLVTTTSRKFAKLSRVGLPLPRHRWENVKDKSQRRGILREVYVGSCRPLPPKERCKLDLSMVGIMQTHALSRLQREYIWEPVYVVEGKSELTWRTVSSQSDLGMQIECTPPRVWSCAVGASIRLRQESESWG